MFFFVSLEFFFRKLGTSKNHFFEIRKNHLNQTFMMLGSSRSFCRSQVKSRSEQEPMGGASAHVAYTEGFSQ